MTARFGTPFNTSNKKAPAAIYRDLILKTEQSLEAGNTLAADRSARKLQSMFPKDAKANLLLAQVLAASNKPDLAIPFAENAFAFAPFHPGTNYFLGRLYLETDLYEKATPLFREGLKKAPNSALLHWALADMYMAMNLGETAIKHYETAQELPLDISAKHQMISSYASALASINRHEDAAKQLSTLKDLPGLRAQFLMQKAEDTKNSDPIALESEIRAELLGKNLETREQATLLHALGNVLDHMKQHDEAFTAWQKSRSLVKNDFAVNAFVGTVDNMIKFYSKELMQDLASFGHQSERPIFIFGMARSGTTLVEQIIAAHKDGAGVGELGRMSKHESSFFERYADNTSNEKIIRNAKNGELLRDAENYLNLLKIIAPDTSLRVVDKAVAQFHSAGFSHVCFPKAKFIHCNRHPADSFVSAFQNRLNHSYVSDQEHYAQYYLGKEKLVAHWKHCFPENIFELNYEKLVRDPEPIVRSMIAFLGLDWDPNCMRFFEQKTTVQTISLRQVRQPIYTSSVYRWTKYEKHLGPLFAALADAGFTYPEF